VSWGSGLGFRVVEGQRCEMLSVFIRQTQSADGGINKDGKEKTERDDWHHGSPFFKDDSSEHDQFSEV
jgi:hypothetical protein